MVTSRAHQARLQLKAAEPTAPAALGDEAEAKPGAQQSGEKAHDAELDTQLKALENEDYLGRLK